LPQSLSNRRVTAVLIGITSALLLHSFTIPYPQTEWLEIDYGLLPIHLTTIYSVGLAVLATAFFFEPSIRRELRESGALPLVIGLSVAISVATVWMLVPNQPHRFARAVPSLSFLLAWITVLGVGAVLLALKQPTEAESPRMRRYAWVVAITVFVGMLAVHIGSVGHFGRLDDIYDEVWAASAMANFVQTGNFSPSLGGSPYGDTDPLFSRWLLWNGMWAGLLGNTDLFTLRGFPMFAGVLMIGVLSLTLWREPSLTHLSRTVGLALLVSLTVFGRTSHNLRMDIGLGLYGALLLLFLLEYLRDQDRGVRWLSLAGIVLYLGLETIPTVAFAVAFLVGLWLIWWMVWGEHGSAMPLQGRLRMGWPGVAVYALGCLLAGAGYVVVHFLPDFATNLENFQRAQARYVLMGSVASGNPLIPIASTHRFSFVLSPIELFVIYAVLIAFWTRANLAERGLLVMVGVGQVVVHAMLGGSFGYQMTFVPFVVYAAARAIHGRTALILGVFVLLPVMAAAPLRDMVVDWRLQLNQRLIAELDLLSWRVPEGSTVIGDDLFWLTLHDQARFYGHSGLQHYKTGNLIDNDPEMMRRIDPDIVICRPELDTQSWLCDLAADYFGTEPEPFEITMGLFHVYGQGS
jgi:hypothetical protein